MINFVPDKFLEWRAQRSSPKADSRFLREHPCYAGAAVALSGLLINASWCEHKARAAGFFLPKMLPIHFNNVFSAPMFRQMTRHQARTALDPQPAGSRVSHHTSPFP
jgi:hypothetical protein